MSTSENRIESHVWLISSVVILGMAMSILDTTIVNVALATLGRELHSTISQIQWVVTGYMLALAAVIPLSGWAAERFGPRRMYVISLVLFTAGSMLCGISSSATELVIFRVVQGVGGGMLMPLGMMMMAGAAGPKRMGRVMSIVSMPMMLAPILGPTIGGLIVDNASWRWIFYVNVPIGVVAVIAAMRFLPHPKAAGARPLDYRGLGLMALGLPLLTYGLAEVGSTGGFGSVKVILPILAGLALIGAFILHALKVPNPLLNLRLYKRPTFWTASSAMFFLGAALFGGMILLPLYWQHIRGQSVLDAGLLMAPQGLGMALVMPAAGRLTDRLGGGPLAVVGVSVTTLATIPFGMIGAHTSIVWLSCVMLVRGMGIGFSFMPVMTAAFAALDKSELPDATPQLNVVQRVGGSLGTAVLAVVLQRALTGAHTVSAAAAGYGTAFWVSAALTALGIFPAIVLLRAERAARTEHPEMIEPSEEAALEVAVA
ncbi:MAG TPA: DHA2 family efflux MFS transporter permease subunit [Solirubrobacteraceae bacterium]|jgi:EmrB/QacA subfamily drug resistance transporter